MVKAGSSFCWHVVLDHLNRAAAQAIATQPRTNAERGGAVTLTRNARCSLLQVPGSRTTPINGTATRQGESAVLNAFTGTDRGLFRSV
jgi:hypothetical protein